MRSGNAAQHERILRYFARYVDDVRDRGLAGVVIEDHSLSGSSITVDGRNLVNFGNCSYSGLSTDPRLAAGAIDLVERYGSSFSSSVAYASIGPLRELRERIGQMYGGWALVLSTTTLAHLAALPVIVSPGSKVLVDAQAHASVHMACQLLKSTGIAVDLVRHNDVEELRTAIDEAARGFDTVWYLADGVYSMFGDTAPLPEVRELLDTYENLYVYMDDAHGVGWTGPSGTGVVVDSIGTHDRMVIAISLSKSFGAGGGAVVFPNPDMAHRVEIAAGAYNFGGPLQPAAVGAGLAAAEIMMSGEIDEIRRSVERQIDLVIDRGRRSGLPFAAWDRTPIWFVRVGTHERVVDVATRLQRSGFHVNPAFFPIVPQGQAGIRFTHTLQNSTDQLESLLDTLAEHVSEEVEVTIDMSEFEDAAGASESKVV